MFSFFKNSKNLPEVPSWASYLTKTEYSKFIKSIDSYFYKQNITYRLEDGYLEVGPNDFDFTQLGLVNLSQICKQDEPQNYKKIISRHFDTMVRSNKFDKDFQKIIHDFEQIKQYVAVRLYHQSYFETVGKENTIGKDFAGDIYAALVFDLPDNILSITPEQAEKWNKSIDELFGLGVKNVREACPINVSQESFNNLKIWIVEGNHFFVPNVVFDLDKHPQVIGTYGSLIGIPHRHGVIIYPIENLQVINAITTLIPLIKGMNTEGPGSISNNLFWYNAGVFEDLPYEIQEEGIQFYPTENFTNQLSLLQSKE